MIYSKYRGWILSFIVFLIFSLYPKPRRVWGSPELYVVQGYSQEEEILSSEELTIRAWEALSAKDYKTAIFYANRCIEQYLEEADKQQASLENFPARGKEEQFWALNDVGTSLFIKGEAFMKQEMWKEAKEMFNRIMDDYSFAQCWDPRGWFWKVAKVSKVNLEKIAKAEKLESEYEIK